MKKLSSCQHILETEKIGNISPIVFYTANVYQETITLYDKKTKGTLFHKHRQGIEKHQAESTPIPHPLHCNGLTPKVLPPYERILSIGLVLNSKSCLKQIIVNFTKKLWQFSQSTRIHFIAYYIRSILKGRHFIVFFAAKIIAVCQY